MTEQPEETSRVIPGIFITAFGVPVSLELNRGVLEVHFGNVDLSGDGEKVALRPSGSALVNVTSAGESGTAGTPSTHHVHIKAEPREEREGWPSQRWMSQFQSPVHRMQPYLPGGVLSDVALTILDAKSPEGEELLGKTEKPE